MKNRNILKIIFLLLLFLICILSFLKIYDYKKISNLEDEKQTTDNKNSNIIYNVEYYAKDNDGNEYIIKAREGEIDLKDNSTIFLKDVKAVIKLKEKEMVLISADFGKYNNNNFDTIFSKNVLINYLEKKIKSEYLDFSILRNSMIISKDVIYTDQNTSLKTDIIEINIKTKDFKFLMFDRNNKVQIINKN